MRPAHLNTRVSKTDPEWIQEQRLKCTQLEQALSEVCVELEKSSIEIDNELSNDFEKICESADTKITSFMKLLARTKNAFYWEHYRSTLSPMIIRFCLSLAAKKLKRFSLTVDENCSSISSSSSRMSKMVSKLSPHTNISFGPSSILFRVHLRGHLSGSEQTDTETGLPAYIVALHVKSA